MMLLVAMPLTILAVALLGYWLAGMTLAGAILLGAVTSATDAAAVFSVLRVVPLPKRLTGSLEADLREVLLAKPAAERQFRFDVSALNKVRPQDFEAVERVLYRPQYFDKIVAWGGGDAINNVMKYIGPGFQLVSFDPKNDWAHRFVPVPPDVISEQIEAATKADIYVPDISGETCIFCPYIEPCTGIEIPRGELQAESTA